MNETNLNTTDLTLSMLEGEKERITKRDKLFKIVRHLLWILMITAAISSLVVCLWTPVIQIFGHSMEPAMTAGDIVLTRKGKDFNTGDIIVFDYNNRRLVKRVIAGPGDWVDIDDDGTVYINGSLLEEPYLTEKALGQSDIEYPFQVQDGHWFVMGDHRDVSVDSRTRAIGTVSDEQIVGKLLLRIWPLNKISLFNTDTD